MNKEFRTINEVVSATYPIQMPTDERGLQITFNYVEAALTDTRRALRNLYTMRSYLNKKEDTTGRTYTLPIGPLPRIARKPSKHAQKCGVVIEFACYIKDKATAKELNNTAYRIAKQECPDAKVWKFSDVIKGVAAKEEANFHLKTEVSQYGTPYQKASDAQKMKLRNDQIPGANVQPEMVILIMQPTSSDSSLMERAVRTNSADVPARTPANSSRPNMTRIVRKIGEVKHEKELVCAPVKAYTTNGKKSKYAALTPFEHGVYVNADPLGGYGEFDRISSANRSKIKAWAENCGGNVHVLLHIEDESSSGHKIEWLKPSDLFPEYNTESITDSEERANAQIWAKALGWEFASPLYHTELKYKDPAYFIKRNGIMKLREKARNSLVREYYYRYGKLQEQCRDNKLSNEQFATAVKNLKTECRGRLNQAMDDIQDPDTSKPASSKEKFQLYHRITPDSEVQEFDRFYKALEDEGLVEETITEGYQLCPHCGRPVRIDKADLNLADISDDNQLMIITREASNYDRFVRCTKDEFEAIASNDSIKLSMEAGTVRVVTLAEGLKEMNALSPQENLVCTCGFEIPAQFTSITNAISFDERLDSDEDESAEMLSAYSDDVCNDLRETVADTSAGISTTRTVFKYDSYLNPVGIEISSAYPRKKQQRFALPYGKFDRAISQADFDDARKAYDMIFGERIRHGFCTHIDTTVLARRAYKGEAYAEPVSAYKYELHKVGDRFIRPWQCPAASIDTSKIVASLTNNCLGRCPAFEALEK